MKSAYTKTNPFVLQSATYQIRDQDCMELNWSDLLVVMHIYPVASGADPPVTLLEGRLKDLAVQARVINLLHLSRS
jgi:hypothetical protein